MQYESNAHIPAPIFLPDHGNVFSGMEKTPKLLEWVAEHAANEVLLCNGRPVARIICNNRRWSWSRTGGPAMHAGSRAEARQLATFYARRTFGA